MTLSLSNCCLGTEQYFYVISTTYSKNKKYLNTISVELNKCQDINFWKLTKSLQILKHLYKYPIITAFLLFRYSRTASSTATESLLPCQPP